MRKVERDFIVLFTTLWYRDFPLSRNMSEEGRVRAMYTAHFNGIVKSCADLRGHYVLYEQGKRTDAIIKTPEGKTIAKIEIEWRQAYNNDVNEVVKLSDAANADEASMYIFVNYSERQYLEDNLSAICSDWKAREAYLMLFLVTYDWGGAPRRRHFKQLCTYIVARGRCRLVRQQPALPWEVPDTRWSAAALEAD